MEGDLPEFIQRLREWAASSWVSAIIASVLGVIVAVGSVIAAWEAILRSIRWLKGLLPGPKPRMSISDQEWDGLRAKLNPMFDGRAELVSWNSAEPVMECLGEFPTAPDIEGEVQRARQQLSSNRTHGLLHSSSKLDQNPAKLIYETAEYALIRALRGRGERPKVISANAILCCSALGLVGVHFRKRRVVDTMQNRMHFVGGGYNEGPDPGPHDRGSLLRTVEREIYEEVGVQTRLPREALSLLSFETPTGFFQVSFLGVDVPADQFPSGDRQLASDEGPEGVFRAFSIARLGDLLAQEDEWVESGRMVYLAWLALGAPTTTGKKFPESDVKSAYARATGGRKR